MKFRRDWTCDSHYPLEVHFSQVIEHESSAVPPSSVRCPICVLENEQRELQEKVDALTEEYGKATGALQGAVEELQDIFQTPIDAHREARRAADEASATLATLNIETPKDEDVPF